MTEVSSPATASACVPSIIEADPTPKAPFDSPHPRHVQATHLKAASQPLRFQFPPLPQLKTTVNTPRRRSRRHPPRTDTLHRIRSNSWPLSKCSMTFASRKQDPKREV